MRLLAAALSLLLSGCAHDRIAHDDLAKAAAMWQEGEAWRRTQSDFPAMSRRDRVAVTLLMATPQYSRPWDRRLGLALLGVYRLTGSEWVYWRAVGRLMTWVDDQRRRAEEFEGAR